MHHQPVVVPGRQPPRLRERLLPRAGPRRAGLLDGAVVEADEGAVQPGDDQVLVVARIALKTFRQSARRTP